MSDSPIKLTGPGGSPGKAWWTPSMGRLTTKARIATASIVAALLAITLVVWNLPTVSQIVTGESTTPQLTAREQELLAENQRLQDELDTSRSQSDSLRDVVAAEQAARQKGEQDRAARESAGSSDTPPASGSSGTRARQGSGSGAGSGSGSGSGSGAAPRGTPARPAAVTPAPAPGSGEGAANPQAPQPTEPDAPPPATAPSAPGKAELMNPDTRYFGMYTTQAPFNWASFDDAANSVGRSQNLVGYFGGWDQDYRANAVTRAWDRGMLPMLTWESRPIAAKNDVIIEPDYTLPKIIDGGFDAYLTRYAQDIVATGLPLAIRLDHEMNGVWYPWAETTGSGASINGNSPGDFVAMWQHVHDIFEANGANDYVIWVWAPNIINNLPAAKQGIDTLRGLYPGDEYVDWVGVSGYQRPPYKADNNATFGYTYDRTLDQLRELTDKKIILAEVGASETGGTKPAWVRSFFQGFDPGANDDVIGFAWFNLAVTTYVEGQLSTNDWRVDSRANSLAAFTEGLADPARNFGGALVNTPAPTTPALALLASPAPAAAPEPSPTATGPAGPTGATGATTPTEPAAPPAPAAPSAPSASTAPEPTPTTPEPAPAPADDLAPTVSPSPGVTGATQ